MPCYSSKTRLCYAPTHKTENSSFFLFISKPGIVRFDFLPTGLVRVSSLFEFLSIWIMEVEHMFVEAVPVSFFKPFLASASLFGYLPFFLVDL